LTPSAQLLFENLSASLSIQEHNQKNQPDNPLLPSKELRAHWLDKPTLEIKLSSQVALLFGWFLAHL